VSVAELPRTRDTVPFSGLTPLFLDPILSSSVIRAFASLLRAVSLSLSLSLSLSISLSLSHPSSLFYSFSALASASALALAFLTTLSIPLPAPNAIPTTLVRFPSHSAMPPVPHSPNYLPQRSKSVYTKAYSTMRAFVLSNVSLPFSLSLGISVC
jgi:hypothetical protein